MEEIGNAAFRKYETCSEQILHVYLASQRSGKLGEGRNASLQPNRLNFWKFGWSDFRDFVLTVPILCPTYPFQWKILAKKTPEVLFTSYMAFVLPTLYTRGSGNLTRWSPSLSPSPFNLTEHDGWDHFWSGASDTSWMPVGTYVTRQRKNVQREGNRLTDHFLALRRVPSSTNLDHMSEPRELRTVAESHLLWSTSASLCPALHVTSVNGSSVLWLPTHLSDCPHYDTFEFIFACWRPEEALDLVRCGIPEKGPCCERAAVRVSTFIRWEARWW